MYAAVLVVALVAAGCVVLRMGPDVTLRVLAGSEIADLEPLLEEVEERTGVAVELEYTGTLDGMARIASGDREGEGGEYDAVWFASNRYLGLDEGGRSAVHVRTSIMVSPVVLGVRADRARELGWTDGAEVTWTDVHRAVAEEGFTYGMTNPGASNSGFSALIGVASAMADTGAALRSEDVEQVGPELAEFFSGQEMTAGSSGWLADAFVRRAERSRPVDGLINYESVILSLNASDSLNEPLTVVYPSDGVVTADYPLTLLSDPSEEALEGYGLLVEDLTSTRTQQRIADQTWRRPVTAGAELSPPVPSLVELPFPTSREVVDGLVGDYAASLRRPARTVYVLDVSGSMEGERLDELQAALGALTGASGGSLASSTQSFQEREEVTLLPFATEPASPLTFVVEAGVVDEVNAELSEAVAGLEAGGDTAAYDALVRAYELLEEGYAGPEDERLMSVVLMTDGEVNRGTTLDEFGVSLSGRPDAVETVPVFTVLFGESDVPEMTELAELTGGQVFDAREQDLEQVFREIRGYQ
ncbi:substrate-binding domain-containing protein [Nocardiopsis halotolerans]|uniref:substrate-binding domain-containing protein n=1 Tax=Nocardiopsis halotolerans TaxID=124252 RepID=UPI000362CD2E|nr:substrate-binding domain-containing protein [Nocardiopsis halotolerans]